MQHWHWHQGVEPLALELCFVHTTILHSSNSWQRAVIKWLILNNEDMTCPRQHGLLLLQHTDFAFLQTHITPVFYADNRKSLGSAYSVPPCLPGVCVGHGIKIRILGLLTLHLRQAGLLHLSHLLSRGPGCRVTLQAAIHQIHKPVSNGAASHTGGQQPALAMHARRDELLVCSNPTAEGRGSACELLGFAPQPLRCMQACRDLTFPPPKLLKL